MSNKLDWLAIIAIGISLITSLSIIVFLIYGLSPVFTGPIGDTFGGLLSPVLGVVSILYIYKTYNAQKEQLKDQKRVNKANIGSVYISEIDTWILEIEKDKCNLLMKSERLAITFIGSNVFDSFVKELERSGGKLTSYSGLHDFMLDSKRIIEKIREVFLFVEDIQSVIDKHSHRFIDRRFKRFLFSILPDFIDVFSAIRSALQTLEFPPDESKPKMINDSPELDKSQHVKDAFNIYKVYYNFMEELLVKKYVTKGQSGQNSGAYIEVFGVDLRRTFNVRQS